LVTFGLEAGSSTVTCFPGPTLDFRAEVGSDFFAAVFRTEEKEKNRDGCGGTGSGVTGDRLKIFVEKLLRPQEDRSVLPRLRSIFRGTSYV